MEYHHEPIMVEEIRNIMNPETRHIIVDGTLGGGGHARALLEHLPDDGLLIGLDQDEEAISYNRKTLTNPNVKLVKENFVNLDSVLENLNIANIDGLLLDLGVSSHQLDKNDRGFSFHNNAPLDMRMDLDMETTARDLVNNLSESELASIIWRYGEERWSKRIASYIIDRREQKPVETTVDLVDIIKAAIPHSVRKKGGHPARKTFQALRIHLNQELNYLEKALDKGIKLLKPSGVFIVLTFHSLEDRIVKEKFREFEQDCICPPGFPVCNCDKEALANRVTRKPYTPSKEEIEKNPRSRSAKLRAVEKV